MLIMTFTSPSNFLVKALVLVVALIVIVHSTIGHATEQRHPLQRTIQIQNHADTSIDIVWVNPISNEMIAMGPSIEQNETIQYDTYVNHTFIIVERQSPSSDVVDTTESVTTTTTLQQDGTIISPPAGQQHQNIGQVPINNIIQDEDENDNDHQILSSYLTITSEDEYEQVIVVQKGLQVERIKHQPVLPTSTTKKTKKNADVQAMIQYCQTSSKDTSATSMIQCMKERTAAILMELNEELSFQRELRRTVANLNENYTCNDLTRTTSVPIRTTTWSYPNDAEDDNHDGTSTTTTAATIRNVGILHEHDASQIHIIHDFISPDECMAIQTAAEPILHRGTVADGKGGSTMSENRKAWQAGISTTSGTNAINNQHILNVKRRLFAYANHATGYNLTLDGQEDLMSIQYFGINSTAPRADSSKTNSDDVILTTPDRYTPHCDGDCSNSIHKFGSRIATMVMYCNIPEDGRGGTNFQQSNIYIKPTIGAGVYFSYMNPISMIHDEGFTTHSGCPVLYGTKRIAVQWMRHGVDNDNPWDSFDTNNIKLSSLKE